MAEEGQGAEEGGKDVWCNAVKRFADGVRDCVGPWGGGDLISGESGAVCKGAEDGGEGSRRLRRKKVVEQGVVDLGGGGGIREGGEARCKSF